MFLATPNWQWLLLGAAILLVVVAFYLVGINDGLGGAPYEAEKLCGPRWTEKDVKAAYDEARKNPTNFSKLLPPKTGRRYIVTGGSGNVGGWIVQQLLERGEDPRAIRIFDINPPLRPAITRHDISFIRTDVTDPTAVTSSFNAPWPSSLANKPLTVFHTVAYISSSKRAPDFLEPFMKVNVEGTRNALAAAKAAGCSIFVTTSSASICLRPPGFFFWPTPTNMFPSNFFQMHDNAEPDDINAPLENFAGCYAYSKAQAEKLVRDADSKEDGFRTGAIRPGHAIYGHGDENPASIGYAYLKSGGATTWLSNTTLQFVSAQNVSYAHLLFEAKLFPTNSDSETDLGGNAYCITDPGPPMKYASLYTLLATLAHPNTPIRFPTVAPLSMVLLAYLIESYDLLLHRYPVLRGWLPPLKGDLEKLQVATLNYCTMHVVYADDRAREELGYAPELGTMEGLCLQVQEWNDRVEGMLIRDGKVEGMQDYKPAEARIPPKV